MTWDDGTAIRTLYGECRGADSHGQRAVAHSLLNRLATRKWGTTLSQVCLFEWKGIHQFSCWNYSDPNLKLMTSISDFDPVMIQLAASLSAARQEADFTEGSTHYFAKSMPKAPIWTLGATCTGEWGGQRFFKGVE